MMEESGINPSQFQRIQMIGTFISRVFGLVRVMIISALLGDKRINDIFQLMFRLVNVLRNSMGEEAIKNSFLPIFKKYQQSNEKEYDLFLGSASYLLISVILPLIVLGILLAPYYVPLYSSGFQLLEERNLAVRVTQLLFPFLLFIGLSSFFMGLLYCEERSWAHVVTSLAPISLTLVVIVLYFFRHRLSEVELLYYLALAQVGGAFLQFLVVRIAYFLKKHTIILPVFSFSHGGVKEIVKQWIPASLGSAVVQVNLLFEGFLAGYAVEGAVTALTLSARLFQLPVGLFGVSSAVSLHASLARHWIKGDRKSFLEDFFWGICRINYFAIPAATGLIIMGYPIAWSLFHYGKFGERGVGMVAICLIFHGLGIPFFCTNKLLKTAFSASQDNRSYAIGDGLTVAVNIALCLSFFSILGMMGMPRYPGLALGTTISAMFQSTFLVIVLMRKKDMVDWQPLGKNLVVYFGKILVATFAMGTVIALSLNRLNPFMATSGRSLYIMITMGIIFLGLGIYGLVTYIFRIDETLNMVNKFRKAMTWFR